MCCVMPPDSPATTFVFRMESRSRVFPWSTCPMTVTTGGRGLSVAGSSGASSSSSDLGVLLLAHRLEVELVQQELDLVEVQALVDGDHQAQVLEGRAHELARRNVDELGKLGHRQELVHPHRLRSSSARWRGFLGPLLHLLAAGTALALAALLLPAAALELGHDALDVVLHGVLVHAPTALPLLLVLLPTVRRVAIGLDANLAAGTGAGRRHGAGSRLGGRTAARRLEAPGGLGTRGVAARRFRRGFVGGLASRRRFGLGCRGLGRGRLGLGLRRRSLGLG
jgi:hypothetical protein